MPTVSASNIEQIIPQPSTTLASFLDSDIRPLSMEERQNNTGLDEVDTKEPLLFVSKDERNYIYSFTKAVKCIEAEISMLKGMFIARVFLAVFCPILLALFWAASISVDGRMPEPVVIIALFCGALAIYAISDLFISRYFKKIKELKKQKTAVFTYGQDYIKQLKEEYKKPVLNL